MKKTQSSLKRLLNSMFFKIPFIGPRTRHYNYLKEAIDNCGFEPGHFYSPVPNLIEIEKDSSNIFIDKDLPGIDLNTENQIKLLEEFKTYYPEYPYFSGNVSHQNLRYKKDDAWYRYSDCVFLYCMMRRFKPKRIFEIGSGHSSSIMLDINERFFNNSIHHTFIEPYPEERLNKLLTESDKISNTIIKDKVQSVKPEIFNILDENDILFIDSTHVSKVGSDVNYLLFEVIPRLKPGVLIHFHDIFYPFELPQNWILEKKWFWNEIYLLRAFLTDNRKYEIVAFNTYLQKIRPDWFVKEMPECLLGSEDTGSIWIRKLA
jgi:hypothetical protein